MCNKLNILLWKEAVYRLKIGTFVVSAIIILLGLVVNLKVKYLVALILTPEYVEIKDDDFTDCKPLNDFTKLAYEPSSAFSRKFIEIMNETNPDCFSNIDLITSIENEGNWTYGIQFHGIKEGQMDMPDSLDYTIFLSNKYEIRDSSKIWERPSESGARIKDDDPKQVAKIVLPKVVKLQMVIDKTFLRMQKEKNGEMDITNQETLMITAEEQNKHFQKPKYVLNGLYLLILPLLLFVQENERFLGCLLKEQNNGVNEFLKIMSISKITQRFAQFLYSWIMHLISILLLIMFLYIPLKSDAFVYQNVNPGVMFACLLLSALATTNFVYFLTCCIKNERTVSFINGFLWFIAATITFTSVMFPIPIIRAVYIVAAVFPQAWCIQVLQLLSRYEAYGKKNIVLSESLIPDGDFVTFGEYVIIGICTTIGFFLLGAYLEPILPGKYGRSHPMYYLFKKDFWLGEKELSIETVADEENRKGKVFEEEPKGLAVGISIQHLSKTYAARKRAGVYMALNNVNLNFYEGEITGVLGHNGAGKTTLISILTGMIPATSGKVIVKGKDVSRGGGRNGMSIGYCPQHEILLENLSVHKNLVFFGMAKGLAHKQASQEARHVIVSLGLQQRAKAQAAILSGGQKRKLSLGISLMGDPQILIFDEPSTGVDVNTRRQISELIMSLRGSKTIILITHFMEEADTLCDRVVVLASGEIQCYGSIMFLKSKFGAGYSLSIVTKRTGEESSTTALVKKHIKGANFKFQNVQTLVYELPEKEQASFPELFEALDAKKNGGEILFYNVTVSTMEDVFLNIDKSLKEELANKKRTEKEVLIGIPTEEISKSGNLKNIPLLCNQFWALLIKKGLYFRGRWLYFLFVTVIVLSIFMTAFKYGRPNLQ